MFTDWIADIILKAIWFVLQTLWELIRLCWPALRRRNRISRADAQLRQQQREQRRRERQERLEQWQREDEQHPPSGSPFAQIEAPPDVPRLPRSSSPFNEGAA